MIEPEPTAETRAERAARWSAAEARRRGIVAGAGDWREAAQRLHAAGEVGDAVLVALGLEPTPPTRAHAPLRAATFVE